MDTILMTELGAVNLCLDIIGEEPINTLDTTGATDAATAYRMLTSESRAVQERGWTFNKEYNYPLLVNSSTGKIEIPSNTLFVDPVENHLVQRGLFLYNRRDHTYKFSGTMYAEIVLMLDFDELPSYARSYIAIKNARKFQSMVLGSDTTEKLTLDDEKQAYATMVSREINAGDYNFLDAADVMRARRRRP